MQSSRSQPSVKRHLEGRQCHPIFYLLAVWPWTSYFNALSFNFFSYNFLLFSWCGWIIKFKETLKSQDLEKKRMIRSISQFQLFLHLCITWFKIQIPRGKASDGPGSDHAAIHALWLTVWLRLHWMTGEKVALWRELPDRDLTTGKGTGPAQGDLTERGLQSSVAWPCSFPALFMSCKCLRVANPTGGLKAGEPTDMVYMKSAF